MEGLDFRGTSLAVGRGETASPVATGCREAGRAFGVWGDLEAVGWVEPGFPKALGRLLTGRSGWR